MSLPMRFLIGDLKIITLVFALALLTACSGGQKRTTSITLPGSEAAIRQALYGHYREWASIPYQYGGLSKSGIDCSGFVYLTFAQKLGVHLPRTSDRQAQTGRLITQQQLRTGDLVFFNTGPQQHHVGIYIEQRRFLHVSTIKGVAISSLDNQYWSDRYWKSVRVLSS
ncbi:MAG: glycoside hydrolase [Gammaproteobacteria bacterium HGW-Gammaproteobacteria-10]|nr:MAG: glycoside hydrolase [Gammaproteobacteria bacterium HGW-Gammaproteobacteria-10]